jgi:hypothetical protein
MDKIITKEIPIPTEKAMLVKLLMSLGEKYELKGTRISVQSRGYRENGRVCEGLTRIVASIRN